MREPSRYLLSRCLVLTTCMLAGSLLLALRAGPASVNTYLLQEYASSLGTGALIVFSAGLIGSALMEDVLGTRKRGG